jgi:hypothetical protein
LEGLAHETMASNNPWRLNWVTGIRINFAFIASSARKTSAAIASADANPNFTT